MECTGQDEACRTSWSSTAPVSVSRPLDFVLLLDLDGLGRESEVDGAQLFFTLNKILRASHQIILPSISPQVLWRQARDEATGVGTLAVAAAILHTGGSGHMVAIH